MRQKRRRSPAVAGPGARKNIAGDSDRQSLRRLEPSRNRCIQCNRPCRYARCAACAASEARR